ncbi:hypothetical protein BDZ91DRAFT_210334 [Kalaharituber pfeilii]|nr:hypothetical protein BDZ91DRAFT_210334 [Kalaharituber pfeilii]
MWRWGLGVCSEDGKKGARFVFTCYFLTFGLQVLVLFKLNSALLFLVFLKYSLHFQFWPKKNGNWHRRSARGKQRLRRLCSWHVVCYLISSLIFISFSFIFSFSCVLLFG